MNRLGIPGLILLATTLPAAASQPLPFTAGSFSDIEKQYTGEPFLVVLWSLECPPCYKELALLGRSRQEHPGLPLVIVSTDDIDHAEEAEQVLARYGLDDTRWWMFADPFVERLRHSIDPQWRGELPRSYFYTPDRAREAHSGLIDEGQLREWARRQQSL